MNADYLYLEMLRAIRFGGHRRTVTSPDSPLREKTLEANPGLRFSMPADQPNVTSVRKVDARWARANVLHFFAETEDAEVLTSYNRFAGRFLEGDRLRGAYGPIALPQMRMCASILSRDLDTRRAIVYMGDSSTLQRRGLNVPSCWSTLHFLRYEGALSLHVSQRSLNVPGVMPYDLILLTNILHAVAWMVDASVHSLVWTVGSLHMKVGDDRKLCTGAIAPETMLIEPETLWSSQACRHLLEVERGLPNDAD